MPSVTGSEGPFANFVAAALRAAGHGEVAIQEFAPGRYNVLAEASGDVDAGRVLFVGHLDTVHARGWEAHWDHDDPRADPFGGAIVDSRVWGRGAGDVKAGICASIRALELLRKAGLEPGGGVDYLFVSDEESGEPGAGTSAGMKAALAFLGSGSRRRRRYDLAVYVEPTRLDVFTAQMGFLIAEITVHGESAYFGTPHLGVDAVKAGGRILVALEELADRLERRAPILWSALPTSWSQRSVAVTDSSPCRTSSASN